ncbi:MAG TPA: DUF1844 domain-containing protein [Thermoanaerobaculia bacterium]|nr:DUF1844 domain-containing protein [Thermoanaerobaculia bacterium]
MPEENKPAQSIKVTDRRLFTAEGEIREEFRDSVKPADPNQPRPEPPKQTPPEPPRKERKVPEADPASESMFMNLIELLVYQASVALGSQQMEGARQLIDIVDMLAEKTAGNLTPSEQEFLESRRGALKLAYVQRTKRI